MITVSSSPDLAGATILVIIVIEKLISVKRILAFTVTDLHAEVFSLILDTRYWEYIANCGSSCLILLDTKMVDCPEIVVYEVLRKQGDYTWNNFIS